MPGNVAAAAVAASFAESGLSRDGTLVILGISEDKIVLSPLQLIVGRKSVVGFLTGSGRDIQVGTGEGGSTPTHLVMPRTRAAVERDRERERRAEELIGGCVILLLCIRGHRELFCQYIDQGCLTEFLAAERIYYTSAIGISSVFWYMPRQGRG